MSSNRFHEYFDPVISSNENKAKAAFLKPGRYHGFDQIGMLSNQPTGDYHIGLFHGDGTSKGAVKVASTTNTVENLGYLVTRHGVVWASEAEDADSGVPLTVPLNNTGDDVFYVIVASYSWVNSPGGSSVEISLETWVPTDPIDPDISEFTSLSDVQFVIGYIRVQAGAKDFAKLTLVPNESPGFAWQDLDNDNIAKRNEPNIFKSYNSFDPDIEGISEYSFTSSTQTLNISSPHNVFYMKSPLTKIVAKNINWDIPNGSEGLIINESSVPFSIAYGGNIWTTKTILIPSGYNLRVFKYSGSYHVISVGLLPDLWIDDLDFPTPPGYGNWTDVVFNPALVPDVMRVGNVPSGESSFQLKYRTDGRGGFVFRAKFQLYGEVPTSMEVNLTDLTHLPGLGILSGFGHPVIIELVQMSLPGFSQYHRSPVVILSTDVLLRFWEGPYHIGYYTSPEVFVSKPE